MAGVVNGVGKAGAGPSRKLPIQAGQRSRLTRPAAGQDNGGQSVGVPLEWIFS